jgi:hypothetical protein
MLENLTSEVIHWEGAGQDPFEKIARRILDPNLVIALASIGPFSCRARRDPRPWLTDPAVIKHGVDAR